MDISGFSVVNRCSVGIPSDQKALTGENIAALTQDLSRAVFGEVYGTSLAVPHENKGRSL